MADIILIVEDNLAELAKAKTAASEQGFKAAVATTYEEALAVWKSLGDIAKGLVTDLHFAEKEGKPDTTPCGIALAVKAHEAHLPVVIVTNMNHHDCEYLWHTWALLNIPATESKDWRWAAEKIRSLITKGDAR